MKINKNFLIYFLCTIPFIADGGIFETYNVYGVKNIYWLIKAAASIVVGMQYFYLSKKFTMLELLFIGYHIYLVVITFLLSRGSVVWSLKNFCNAMTIFMLYHIGLKNDPKQFIKSQYYCLGLGVYANFVSEIILTNGLTTSGGQMWFWGYYNTHSRYYVMAILMLLLYAKVWKKFIGPAIQLITIYFAALILRSGGTLLFLFATAFLLIFSMNGRYSVNYYLLWIVPLAFATLILLVQSEWFLNYTYTVSESAFQKGASLMGRVSAWQRAVFYISRNPVFGYGMESPVIRQIKLGWAMHCHNLVLQLLLDGGLILFMFFASMVKVAGRNLAHLKSRQLHSLICIAFTGWVLITLVEPYTTPFLLALFVVAYRSPYIEKVFPQPSLKHKLLSHQRLVSSLYA